MNKLIKVARTWCGEERQTTIHMLRDCPKITGLTRSPWDANLSLHERVKAIRVLQYIYTCNFSRDVPNQDEFEATLAFHKELDRLVSSWKGAMRGYERRWGKDTNVAAWYSLKRRATKVASGNLLPPLLKTPPWTRPLGRWLYNK